MDYKNITTKLLNKNDPLEIEAFEKAFFNAFKGISDPSLNAIWDINKSGGRIKTRIPYGSQEIMTVKIDDSIIAASAVNYNMNDKLQLEEFGFSIDKNEGNICEALFIFNNHPDISFMMAFKEKLFEYLISKNILKFYGTCSQKRIKGYRLLGFTDIDTRLYNGQVKYLLMIPLDHSDTTA